MSYTKYINGTHSPEYAAYNSAKARCTNSNHPNYKHYGQRGIRFLFSSFEEFIDEIGLRPSSLHSLDRENNDGHYEPGNVRWATPSEQANNRRTKLPRHKYFEYDTIRRTVWWWDKFLGLPKGTVVNRIEAGFCSTCIYHKEEKCFHI